MTAIAMIAVVLSPLELLAEVVCDGVEVAPGDDASD